MAQIVCITKETYRKGINNIGDIVSIYDDDVQLSGTGYKNVKIIKAEGTTAKEVRSKLVGVKTKMEGEKEYWKKGTDWYEIKVHPKYSFCIGDLTTDDLSKLSSGDLTALSKLKDNISLETKNNETKL